MRLLLLIISFVSMLATAFAETKDSVMAKLKYDSSLVEVRAINTAVYTSEPAFQYNKINEPATSLWDRFWSWFWMKVYQILGTEGGSTALLYFVIAFVVFVIVFFVFKVTGMNRGGLFGRNNSTGLAYNVTDDDIHAIDFNYAIDDAATKGNYRLAIRLLYLQTLKILTDKSVIQWQIDKTNAMYVNEMRNHAQQHNFATLTNTFDTAWYGNNTIDKETYSAANTSFRNFQQQV